MIKENKQNNEWKNTTPGRSLSSYYTTYSTINVIIWIFCPTWIMYLLDQSELAIVYWGFLTIVWLVWHASHWWQTESMVMEIEKSLKVLNTEILTNISEILERSLQIQNTLEKLYTIQKSGFTRIIHFFYRERDVNALLLRYVKSCYKAHMSAKAELQTQILQETLGISWAKESLHEISWAPSYDAVIELQKTRLDRQIEQFEELQRVLTKK